MQRDALQLGKTGEMVDRCVVGKNELFDVFSPKLLNLVVRYLCVLKCSSPHGYRLGPPKQSPKTFLFSQ